MVTSQAEALAAAWPSARPVAALAEALADPASGLVVIATPNALHAPQAIAALEAGKAVVIDKPFALDLVEARSVAALAEARGLLLSVFHNRRRDADFLALKAELASGRLGPIHTFESHFDRFRPEVRDRWRERDEPGGGVWHDLGPHLIDQALVLFGRPLGITCDLAVLREGGQAIDWAHAVLRYTDKRVILHADMTSPAPGLRFAVHGAKARIGPPRCPPTAPDSAAGRRPAPPPAPSGPAIPGRPAAPSPAAGPRGAGPPADPRSPDRPPGPTPGGP